MIQQYEQKISGVTRERLVVNHGTGMAKIERMDDKGRVIGQETFGAGSGKVRQFILRAEPQGR